MREIKFRAWDRAQKKMIQPALWVDNIGLGDGSLLVDEEAQQGNELDWLQYTGLKDKSGKEIYEGDIVKMDQWNPSNMQIKFIEGAFCLANDEGEYLGDIHYANEKASVIGNVYENPELLKSL